MGRVMEKVRQTVPWTSNFVPTSNERNTKMLAELAKHAEALRAMEKQAKALEKATDAMVVFAEKAYSMTFPRQYIFDTEGKAVALEVMDPALQEMASKVVELQSIRMQMEDKMKFQVKQPVAIWIADFESIKNDMSDLEKLRLDLDAARRSYYKSELKRGRPERDMSDAPAEADADIHKPDMRACELEAAKQRYSDKEVAVFEVLSDMVARAGLLRDCIVTTFEILEFALQRASVASPVTPAAAIVPDSGSTPGPHMSEPTTPNPYSGGFPSAGGSSDLDAHSVASLLHDGESSSLHARTSS